MSEHNSDAEVKRQKALMALVQKLAMECPGTTVATVKQSKAVITFPDEPNPLVLFAEECEALLDTPETVEQFFETLGSPADTAIELYNVVLEDDALERLTDLFASVEQG